MFFRKFSNYFASFGPGLLLAGTAVGVSHIVQSVQAGGNFGYIFIIAIIAAHFFKYPFFDFAPRYSAATGRSLLYGYNSLGRPVLLIYIILTLLSMFTIQAVVTIVAASILNNLWQVDIIFWSISLLSLTLLILIFGQYKFLDSMVKYIIIILSILTLIAVFFALSADVTKSFAVNAEIFDISNKKHLLFLIAFLGWMPCPLDCAVWNSIWVVDKNQTLKKNISYDKTMLDFRIGYFVTALLAICFLSLGASLIYGTNIELSEKGSVFVGQFLGIYTKALGDWSYYLIAFAALATMFSTVISCFDAFGRTLSKSIKILCYEPTKKAYNEDRSYIYFLVFTFTGTILVLLFLLENMMQLVTTATIINFVTAPILAFLNYKLVTRSDFPEKYQPGKRLRILSLFSLTALLIFAGYFLTL
jgi:Mn2+/Fe2+ NRAMP family transporter